MVGVGITAGQDLPPRRTGRRGLATALGLALSAAAVAGGALAGRHVWRRRRAAQQRRLLRGSELQRQDAQQRQRLLHASGSSAPHGPGSGLSSLACEGGGGGGGLTLARRRKAGRRVGRVEALLLEELGGPSCRLDIHPGEDLLQALAHKLEPTSQAGTIDSRWLDSLSPGPPSPSEGPSAGEASLQPLRGAAAADALESRRWGLETESLRLPPAALEVRVGRLRLGCGAAGKVPWRRPMPCRHAQQAPPPMPPAPPQFMTDDDGLLVELGEGAHAVVYLARLQGREVAVKARAARPC